MTTTTAPERRRVLQTLAGMVLTLAGAQPVRAAPAAAGEAVRWPEVTLLDGRPWAAPRAEAAVVVFWSLTCPFCRRHNEHVERLFQAARGKPLRVLGVVRERDSAAVRRTMQSVGWTFPVTADTAAMAGTALVDNEPSLTTMRSLHDAPRVSVRRCHSRAPSTLTGTTMPLSQLAKGDQVVVQLLAS